MDAVTHGPETVRTWRLAVCLAVCQVSVPARHFGSGTYMTLPVGLGSGVDAVGFAARVGESTVSLGRVVFDGMSAQQPTSL